FSCSLVRTGDSWDLAAPSEPGLRKRHDLQGPIDDAFMDSFVFVRPTGKGANPKFDEWAARESARAVEHWRRQFRGEAPGKDDTAITDADIAGSNLVLWGDTESNAVLKRISEHLPISWNRDRIKVGGREFPSAGHALILVYPNPLNPRR